eukprot:scaffold6420_cov168-Amphora_coffeaeformis.AAC.33
MSPRDRKRDRALKRRRESKKKERGDQNDEGLEQSHFASREQHLAKKVKVDQSPSTEEERLKASVEEKLPFTKEDAKAKARAKVLTKEERQRLKNQQRKALHKEKKKKKEELSKNLLEMNEQEERKIQQQKLLLKKAVEENVSGCFESLRLGVQYKDVIVGKGPVVQDNTDVRVSYKLRVEHRHGKIIDSSPDFRFRVGIEEVVKGWDIGLLGMRQGGLRYLIVPPQAGYGQENVGAGPGGLLFFEITLISCS